MLRALLLWLLQLLLEPTPSCPWTFPGRIPTRSLPRRKCNGIVLVPPPASGTSDTTSSYQEVVDSQFMKLALDEGKKAGARGEVPIGALVVRPSNQGGDHYEILSAASNRVEEQRDASAHAELLALRHAARRNREWRLINCTLYTTVEPCAMCLAASQAFRVGRIVYGAPDLRIGAIDTYLHLLETPHPIHTIGQVVRGVHGNESATLLRDFFQSRRRRNKKGPLLERGRPWKLSSIFRRKQA